MGDNMFKEIKLNTIGFHSNLVISRVCSVGKPFENSVMFVKRKKSLDYQNLKFVKNCLVFLEKDFSEVSKLLDKSKNHIVECDNPRLEYAKFLNNFVAQTEDELEKFGEYSKANSAFIHEETKIESGVTIHSNSKIGKGTRICSGAVILSNVTIGENCFIGHNSVIGGDGFGLERDNDKHYRIPHFGGVKIGNNVNIGANCTVRSGNMNPTIIEDNVSIDDLSVIAHNCIIGKSSIICGCSSLGGSVKLEENVWIGSGSTILQNLIIAEGATIGLGSVVRKSIKNGVKVLGNPALPIEEFGKREAFLKLKKNGN